MAIYEEEGSITKTEDAVRKLENEAGYTRGTGRKYAGMIIIGRIHFGGTPMYSAPLRYLYGRYRGTNFFCASRTTHRTTRNI